MVAPLGLEHVAWSHPLLYRWPIVISCWHFRIHFQPLDQFFKVKNQLALFEFLKVNIFLGICMFALLHLKTKGSRHSFEDLTFTTIFCPLEPSSLSFMVSQRNTFQMINSFLIKLAWGLTAISIRKLLAPSGIILFCCATTSFPSLFVPWSCWEWGKRRNDWQVDLEHFLKPGDSE